MPDRDKLLKIGDYVVILPGKSPDEIFIMCLCLVTAIPIILGKAPAPGSVDALMHPWLVFGWSLTLAIGAGIVLISFFFKDRVLGMIWEQFGTACLGSAAALYALVIFLTSYDQGGAFGAALVFGFALARGAQFRSYQKTLNKIQKVKLLVEAGGQGGNQR